MTQKKIRSVCVNCVDEGAWLDQQSETGPGEWKSTAWKVGA